jgi:hypothetical protein
MSAVADNVTRASHLPADRAALLERYGRCYGANHLAVAFTSGIAADAAKRVTTTGWHTTLPLPDGDFGAALIANRGRAHNPVIVLRPSGLIGVECDTPADLERIERLQLPATATVRSSKPYKRHLYFRPPAELEALPFVGFRFESGELTADAGRYFVAPPAIHKDGTLYEFLPERAIDEIGFATMPASVYRDLARQARGSQAETRTQLQEDPAAKVLPGRRRDMLFRYACALRRWTADRAEIAEAVHRWNVNHCAPPVERHLVEVQIDGAMRKPGSQALRARMEPAA